MKWNKYENAWVFRWCANDTHHLLLDSRIDARHQRDLQYVQFLFIQFRTDNANQIIDARIGSKFILIYLFEGSTNYK